jgi:uncharacterized coiled-coil protein SlyX
MIEIRSNFLGDLIYSLDYKLCNQEATIHELNDEIDRLNKKISSSIDKEIQQSNAMVGNILNSLVGGVPTVTSIGPVGATVIAKINDMTTIKQVKDYIKLIKEENADELESIKKEK